MLEVIKTVDVVLSELKVLMGRFIEKFRGFPFSDFEEINNLVNFGLTGDEIGDFGALFVVENVILDFIPDSINLYISLAIHFIHQRFKKSFFRTFIALSFLFCLHFFAGLFS